jgi:hypothetical protein
MAIGVEKVLRFGLAAGDVKLLLVEHQRDLVRIKLEVQNHQSIRVLAVEQVVPGVAAAGFLEKLLLVGGTTHHPDIADVVGQHHIGPGQLVGAGLGLVAHERQPVIVVLHIELYPDPDLAQIGKARRGAARFFHPGDRRHQHRRENRDNGNDDQEFDEREGRT